MSVTDSPYTGSHDLIAYALDLLAILGTFLLAGVAIWGQQWRRCIADPKLELKLSNATGSVTDLNKRKPDGESVSARFFHCTVSTSNRSFPFRGVRILLYLLEADRREGWETVWEGRVPLRWRHEERLVQTGLKGAQPIPVGYEPKVVGAEWQADLFHVTEERGFAISPFIIPNSLINALNSLSEGPLRLRMTVRAISEDGDSEPLRIAVAWDGVWEANDERMTDHLEVTPAA